MGIRTAARKWDRALASLPPGRRAWGAVTLLGWWLSPLTAWNDSFTNVPLAIGIAWLLGRLGCPADRKALAVAAYIFTNVLGIVLLWMGAGKLSFPRETRPSSRGGWILQALARTLVYAALVYVTVWSIQALLSGA
jgi:hypothetical protein